jgi:IS30 family transposase
MGNKYKQFASDERYTIARLHEDGQSFRQIATALGRSPSSVAREVKRNSTNTLGYRSHYADTLSKSRRWSGSKLERNDALRENVLNKLARGWSPEQTAGRIAEECGKSLISYETIYRFIDAQIRRTKDYSWRLYLPRAKSKRGFRGRRGGSSVINIKNRVSVHDRPYDADNPLSVGHWEADTMLFAKYGQVILVTQERSSKLLVISKQPNKSAKHVADKIKDIIAPLPEHLRRSMTFDNGTEFAGHHTLPIPTFFCDPHAPWQKGGVENSIGRLRRMLPRKTDISTLSEDDILDINRIYNHTPRKCLDFRTPAEVFLSHLLHFKCESTFPFSRE